MSAGPGLVSQEAGQDILFFAGQSHLWAHDGRQRAPTTSIIVCSDHLVRHHLLKFVPDLQLYILSLIFSLLLQLLLATHLLFTPLARLLALGVSIHRRIDIALYFLPSSDDVAELAGTSECDNLTVVLIERCSF